MKSSFIVLLLTFIIDLKNNNMSKIREYLRPCDCTDEHKARLLDNRGIKHNNEGVTVEYGRVTLELGTTTVKISVHRFKQFAKWFLEKQEI